jgi:hypothetical protein
LPEGHTLVPLEPEQELTLDALEAELRKVGIQAAGAHPTAVAVPPPPLPEIQPPEPTPPRPSEAVMREPPRERLVPSRAVAAAADPTRSLRRWRLAAILLAVLAVLLAGLIIAWRAFPDRLPAGLRPGQVLKLPEAPPVPPRPTAPPESRFDE